MISRDDIMMYSGKGIEIFDQDPFVRLISLPSVIPQY